MTDAGVVSARLNRIEACVRELRELLVPAEVHTDIRARRFAEHTLQIAIQAAQDVASHIVSARRLGEPSTNAELFRLLSEDGWLPAAMVPTLRAMIGFRNVVVHGYDTVDLAILEAAASDGLADLDAFVTAVRARMLTG